MEDFYIKCYKDCLNKMCAGCKHCEFDGCIVSDADDFYHGYDGTSFCRKWDSEQEDSEDNRLCISALWRKCKKFEKSEKFDYIKELCCHLLYGLEKFPDETKAKTKDGVFENILNLYKETLKLYPTKKDIVYEQEFYDMLLDKYTNFEKGKFDEAKEEITNLFIEYYYDN